jgi:hypothetical protein
MSCSGTIKGGMAKMGARFKEMGGQMYPNAKKMKSVIGL